MLLVAKVKSSATGIPADTVLLLEVDLPQATGEQRLDAEGIAARYSVSVKTVGRWHEEKIIPSFKLGSHVYCNAADLDAMESRCKNPAPLSVGQIPFPIRSRAQRGPRNERMAA